MTEKENEIALRQWFDFYINEIKKSPDTGYKTFDKYFLCPCCSFPTLLERDNYEICVICNWEDDGQDDHNADTVLGGPNQNYSLTEARDNFKRYLTSYRPSDKHHFDRTTIKKTFNGKIILDLTLIKRQIIEKYKDVIMTTDLAQREKLLGEISELEKRLN
jgi:hypothetical protein